MKGLLVSALALGLFAASSGALAQSYNDQGRDDQGYGNDQSRYGDQQYDNHQYDNHQYGSQDDRYSNPDDGGYYDYARVIRVDPVLADDAGRYQARNSTRRCRSRTTYDRYSYDNGRGGYGNDGYYGDGRYYGDNGYGYGEYGSGSNGGRTAATVVGGIVGAVLGSKIGNGSGSVAAAGVGTLLGSMAGREIYDQHQRETRRGTVVVCDPEPVGDDGDGRDGRYDGSGINPSAGYDVTYEYNGRQYTRRMDYNPGDRIRVRVDVSAE